MNTQGVNPRRPQVAPLEWIWTSTLLRTHIVEKGSTSSGVLVADFGPGENEEVPVFFTKSLRRLSNTNAVVYCIDSHELRLESLMDKASEEGAAANSRFVLARFESMTSKARFLEPRDRTLFSNDLATNDVDRVIRNEARVPTQCFDIGILNNDMIGYLSEYYRSKSDLDSCLSQIHLTMKPASLVIVTQPGFLYRKDNVPMLEKQGFDFRECVDIDLGTGEVRSMGACPDMSAVSRIDHYSFLVLVTK